MYITNLRLQNFRNHFNSVFEFSDGKNVLLGNNGQGKTNVIEAISYLCLTKSFYVNSDSYALNFGGDLFEIEGTILSDHEQEYCVRVAYSEPRKEKFFTINKHRIEPFSSVIGKFPVVICSPEHAPITSEGPAERRKFIDFVISQSNTNYFQNLIEYRNVLKHRNKILLDGKIFKKDISAILEPWNEQLVTFGSYLIAKRKQFVEEFQPFIVDAYVHLVIENERPSIEYQPVKEKSETFDERDIKPMLQFQLKEKYDEEKRIGVTLVGPHRDEFGFKLNGVDLRRYASQGQHKTFLIALKIGEYFYLKERCQETPILLLDDIFSELDEKRTECLLNFVGTLNQTFITSTNPYLFKKSVNTEEALKIFYIQNGNVIEQKAA